MLKLPPPRHKTLAVVIFAALSAQTWANTNDAQQLQEITVTGVSRSTRTENKNTYTTSAMRTTTGLALSPKETPQSVSVITKTQLDERGITRMEDALKNTTGVNVLVEGGRYRYQSRGYYIDQIEEDGISSTVPGSATNTYQDAQSMTDLAVYDHVEVVRGATGLTQANGSPGGTINAVRKRPTAKTQAQVGIQADRFGSVRATGDVSGSLNQAQTVRGRAIAVLERADSFRDHMDGKNGLLYGIIEADAGENTKLTFGALYQRRQNTIDPSGLLMGTDLSDLHLPRRTYLSAPWNEATYNKTNLFGELEHYFNDNWKYSGKISYTYNKSDMEFGTLARRNTGDGSDTARIGILSRYNGSGRQFAVNNNLNGKFTALGRSHDLFFRHSYNHETGNMRNIDAVRDSTASFNIYNYNGDLAYPDWSTYSWNGVSDTSFTTHMLTAGTRFNPLDNLHILMAGSYSRFRSSYVENALRANGTTYSENTFTRQNHFTPYFGITWDFTPNQSLYASYTSIFKPSYGRLDKNGKQVKPKTGNNIEVGWKGAWHNNRLNASVALFQLDEKNRPYTITTAMDPTASRSYTATAGKVRSHGWEAEISGSLTDDWKLFAGYTFNTSKYRFSESSSRPAGLNFSTYTPKHMFRLYTAYTLPFDSRKWEIGGGVNIQSRTVSTGNVKQGGFAVWSANVRYQPTKNLGLGLAVSNLTDKRYYQNQANRNAVAGNFYGEPRNIMFTASWKLK